MYRSRGGKLQLLFGTTGLCKTCEWLEKICFLLAYSDRAPLRRNVFRSPEFDKLIRVDKA